MKSYIQFIFITGLLVPCGLWATDHSLLRTDINSVLSEEEFPTQEPLRLEPGLYELGGLRPGSQTSHYLLLKNDINNPDNFLAVVFPKDLQEAQGTDGYLLVGLPFNNGQEIQLVNLVIDGQGNVSNESMYRERGPYIRVMKNDTNNGRAFYLHGSHPLLQGRNVWGMRSADSKKWSAGGSRSGVYGGSTQNPEALVTRGEISYGGKSYAMIPINGTAGGLIGLTQSSTNIMGGYLATGAEILRLLVFIRDIRGTDVIIDIQPHPEWGKFSFRYIETSFGSGPSSIVSRWLESIFNLK